MVSFSGAEFSRGRVRLRGAKFSGAEVDFREAKFSGGRVSFRDAEFSDGAVDFSDADWSFAPRFPWGMDTPPPVVKLPGKEDQSQEQGSAD